MTDEKFLYVSDVAEKKRVARGSYNKRTHAGKGGKVKLPSDFYSRKELAAMNGEVKSYRLNEPMTWAEFKALPDDIKVMYIKALREKFGVRDKEIGEMLGKVKSCISREMARLGISAGHYCKDGSFDKEGWEKWLNRASKDITVEDQNGEKESTAGAECCELVEREEYDNLRTAFLSALKAAKQSEKALEQVKLEADALRIQLDTIRWTLETIFGRDGNG